MSKEFKMVGGHTDKLGLSWLKSRIEELASQMPAIHVLGQEEIEQQSEEMKKCLKNWAENQVALYWNAMLSVGYSEEEVIEKLEHMGLIWKE